jgi:hypothetical protein
MLWKAPAMVTRSNIPTHDLWVTFRATDADSLMRASRATHQNLPFEPPAPHISVKGLAQDFLDWPALLDREHFEAFPAVFG